MKHHGAILNGNFSFQQKYFDFWYFAENPIFSVCGGGGRYFSTSSNETYHAQTSKPNRTLRMEPGMLTRRCWSWRSGTKGTPFDQKTCVDSVVLVSAICQAEKPFLHGGLGNEWTSLGIYILSPVAIIVSEEWINSGAPQLKGGSKECHACIQ